MHSFYLLLLGRHEKSDLEIAFDWLYLVIRRLLLRDNGVVIRNFRILNMTDIVYENSLASFDQDILTELLRDKRSPNTRRTYSKGLKD